jgi:tRNA U34 5-methylaminomethyl-2-thiouridine-forming methyltransferase MnmC
MPDTVHDLDWDDTGQPRSRQFGDQFYSREDGRAECAHVFIAGNGLPARWHGWNGFILPNWASAPG